MPIDIENIDKSRLDKLAAVFVGEFAQVERERQSKETEWLQSLRQIKGIHDPEIIFDKNESQIYSQYTRSKVIPLQDKLNQHLLPEKEKNWEVKPTPRPKVPEADLQSIIKPLISTDGAGNAMFPFDEEIDRAIYQFTEERAVKMSGAINDGLVEDSDNDKTKEQIKSCILYGTGIKKGPATEPYAEIETIFETKAGGFGIRDYLKAVFGTQVKPEGRWVQKEVTKYRPTGQVLPIWNFFPDLSTTDFPKCKFAYELNRSTKHDMRELAKREDFFGDVIYEILAEKKDGNYKLRNWEQTIQTTNENESQATVIKDYEVVERNGYIDGADLYAAGIISEDDPRAEYFCNFWICDNRCIKISIWPDDLFNKLTDYYHLFYYEKDETSIWGTGLPKILRHRQLAINAGEAHLLNHAAWLVKPCGEINIPLLHPESAKQASNFGPGSFFGKLGIGNDANSKILNIYNVEDRSASLIGVLNFQREQGDLESSLSSSLFGTPSGGDETAKGVSVRFANLLDFIKGLAKNFDIAHVSYIQAHYRWQMKYSSDPNIKGEMNIWAVGSAQALIKDAIREQIAYFLQSLPDPVLKYYKWDRFAKEIAKPFFDDTDKFVYSQDEVDQKEAPLAQKQQEMEDLQKMLMQVKAEFDAAKKDKTVASTEKIQAETPHAVEAKAIDNLKKQSDIENNAKYTEIEDAKVTADIMEKVRNAGQKQGDRGTQGVG